MVFGFGVRGSIAAQLVWSDAKQSEVEHDWVWLHLDATYGATDRIWP